MNPKLFYLDLDLTFQRVWDPAPTFKITGSGSDPKYYIFHHTNDIMRGIAIAFYYTLLKDNFTFAIN
jgi:hypothetical protein